MKECATCESEFSPRNSMHKNCSKACSLEYSRKIRQEYARANYEPRAPRPPTECNACGVEIPAPRTGPLPKWCGQCRARREDVRARKRQVGDKRACHKCGVSVPEAIGRAGLAVCDNCRVDPRKNRRTYERARVLRKYGLTQDEYDKMLQDQDGRCAICRTEDPGKKGWSIDHCHDTDEVRALLCNYCNTALGLVREDIDTLKAMVDFLEQWEKVKI